MHFSQILIDRTNLVKKKYTREKLKKFCVHFSFGMKIKTFEK
jgi:hypothetical protein